METLLMVKSSVEIEAPVEDVWKALTTPELIKVYLFGSETISDWKVGSPLIFTGEWEGKSYVDKGIIKELVPNKYLHYTHLSSFSGQEDKPENYANITYSLKEQEGKTLLSITQDNIATEEARSHSETNWQIVLGNLRDMLEK